MRKITLELFAHDIARIKNSFKKDEKRKRNSFPIERKIDIIKIIRINVATRNTLEKFDKKFRLLSIREVVFVLSLTIQIYVFFASYQISLICFCLHILWSLQEEKKKAADTTCTSFFFLVIISMIDFPTPCSVHKYLQII